MNVVEVDIKTTTIEITWAISYIQHIFMPDLGCRMKTKPAYHRVAESKQRNTGMDKMQINKDSSLVLSFNLQTPFIMH